MKQIYNKNRMAKRLAFWQAQQQAYCPVCGELLLDSGKDSAAEKLFFVNDKDLHSDKYVKKVKHKPQGGYWIHYLGCYRKNDEVDERRKALKLKHIKEALFKAVSLQKKCPYENCKYPHKILVKTPKDLTNVTFEHHSGAYDHAAKNESRLKGGIFMHRDCHLRWTVKDNYYFNKRSVASLQLGESMIVKSNKVEDDQILELYEEVKETNPDFLKEEE